MCRPLFGVLHVYGFINVPVVPLTLSDFVEVWNNLGVFPVLETTSTSVEIVVAIWNNLGVLPVLETTSTSAEFW